LSLRERAASVYWAPTSFTPRTELLSHGGGPTHVRKLAGENFAQLRGLKGCSRLSRKTARHRADGRKAVNDLNNDVPKFVTQARASFLLGIPQEDLRRISEESGLGHLERVGNEEEFYFTYEELRRICQLAYPVPASH
jgi:hypothetical protein